jgi:hypothetical protein
LLHIGYGSLVGMRMVGPLFIGSPRQSGKAFFLEDDVDIGGAEGVALALEDLLDVINGEVLLAGLDNLFPEGVRLGGSLGTFSWGQEKGPGGILSKVVDQDAETPRRIAETASRLFGGELVDKEGAKGLVLAVS